MFIAVRTGLEPATPGVTGPYSNQLNYRTSISISVSLFSGKAVANVGRFFQSCKYILEKISYFFANFS